MRSSKGASEILVPDAPDANSMRIPIGARVLRPPAVRQHELLDSRTRPGDHEAVRNGTVMGLDRHRDTFTSTVLRVEQVEADRGALFDGGVGPVTSGFDFGGLAFGVASHATCGVTLPGSP